MRVHDIIKKWNFPFSVKSVNHRLLVSRALHRLNCKAEWSKEKGGQVAHYTYQGGHFNILIHKDSPYARLSYLFFYQADVEDIEAVRSVCNLCNLNSDLCRVVYTVNEKEGNVDVHIVCVMPLNASDVKDNVERAMADCFRWQTVFAGKFDEENHSKGKLKNVDKEKERARYERDLALIREQEMTHQNEGPDWHEAKDKPFQLRTLLATAMGLTDIIPINFVFTADGKAEVYDNPDDILELHVSDALIADGGFKLNQAVALLNFYDPSDPVTPRHLSFDFEQEEKTKDTLYYRVTMALSPVSAREELSEDSEERQRKMVSVLLGFDLTPSQERLAHFRYVWKEAMGKQQSGDTKDMTDEEKTLAHLQEPNLAYNYYRGRSLYLRKRYYEALMPLKDAFRTVANMYDSHNHRELDMLEELAYLIGCCLMCLKQYDSASYYLQLTLPTSHQSYSEAYINCLVNGNDFRANDILMGLQNSLQTMVQRMDAPDEDDDNDSHNVGSTNRQQLVKFIGFVKRRRAYLLVNQGKFDEAERLLKQLLDDPESSDFALNELAYIQKHR